MDIQTKEALMDKLLIFANDEVEAHGLPLKAIHFDFTEQGEDAVNFLKAHTPVPFQELTVVLNACISRSYIKPMTMGVEHYKNLELTEEGQGRAISVEATKCAPPVQPDSGDIHFHGPVNANGATQIGNNNTQNIENVFTSIIEQIDQTNAPEAQKQEAKSLLQQFLEHPLAGTIVGMTPMAIKALFGGG